MNILKMILGGLIVLALGIGLGYYFAPDKIKKEEKTTTEKEVTKEQGTKVTEKFDPETGKVVERSTETGTKTTTANTKTTNKIVEKEKTRKSYALKGGVAINPRDLSGKLIPRVGGEMRLPIFDSWIGAEADINIDRPLVGAYLRLEF